MVSYTETLLWRKSFETEECKEHASSVKDLITTFDKVRENVKVLVSEISVDLPGYTVHDIEHLDALWEVGSQITGPTIQLNPVEGFVLGCSILFHDSAMTLAAYPGGIDEIKMSKEWRKLSGRLTASTDRNVDEREILEVFLREQHAVRAEELPRVSWRSASGSRYLIDNANARDMFGDFIGQVAASHWWDHATIEREFNNKKIPAPAPFPSSWSIDLMKLACILRTADAAQIDQRRAPSLLMALRRSRLSTLSAQHWMFQNKLTQAQRRDDTLHFASLRPFSKQEAKEWWLLHDALKMVDNELKNTDALLARCRGNEARFAARRVSNIESIASLRDCIPTQGWQPVDTAFTISDIPRLIENLGGDQLYGHDNMAGLREVIQNAMDAVRLRQLVDPGAPPPLVQVQLAKTDETLVLSVRDNGVGMSEQSIVGSLLSFGSSGWLADSSIGEYSDIFPQKSSVSGQYGIGFFSIFMLGSKVEVKSRRFDSAPDQTIILSFQDGLNSRPLLCPAASIERMTIGGTEVKVQLDIAKLDRRFWQSTGRSKFWSLEDNGASDLFEAIEMQFPASDIPIEVNGGASTVLVDGRNWITEPASIFLRRVEGSSYLNSARDHEEALSIIVEATGEIVGRAMLAPTAAAAANRFPEDQPDGALVSTGTKISGGNFRGIISGKPARAARDYAIPAASAEAIQRWATQQGRIFAEILTDGDEQESVADRIAALGGDIGELKFCEVGGKHMTKEELRTHLRSRQEFWLAQDAAIHLGRPVGMGPYKRTDDCVSVDCGITSVFDTPIWAHEWDGYRNARSLREVAVEVICEEFCIPDEVADKIRKIEGGHSVYVAHAPAYLQDGGQEIFVDGEYYKRGMTLEDVDAFFVPESERK